MEEYYENYLHFNFPVMKKDTPTEESQALINAVYEHRSAAELYTDEGDARFDRLDIGACCKLMQVLQQAERMLQLYHPGIVQAAYMATLARNRAEGLYEVNSIDEVLEGLEGLEDSNESCSDE